MFLIKVLRTVFCWCCLSFEMIIYTCALPFLKLKRFIADVPSPQILQEEMAWMKERLSNLGSPVVLCHNDLLCKNIIYNGKQGRY